MPDRAVTATTDRCDQKPVVGRPQLLTARDIRPRLAQPKPGYGAIGTLWDNLFSLVQLQQFDEIGKTSNLPSAITSELAYG
jgi:hypothetical protein